MKKAVIQTGGKQYLVYEGQTVDVESFQLEGKNAIFEPLLIMDGEAITVGTPLLTTHKVIAQVESEEVKAEKVLSIRYKAKKRVHKIRGHRQHQVRMKITSIA